MKNFEKIQIKWAHYGAHDTEPRDQMKEIIGEARKGVPFKPLSADGWHLFSGKAFPLREKAANELSEAAARDLQGVYKP